MGTLPPVFIEFVGSLGGLKVATGEVKKELAAVEKSGGGSMAQLGVLSKAAFLGIGGAAVAMGAKTLSMAGDFQESMTQLVTGAGESESNMGMVSDGILNMAGQVGESTKDLASGMYLVESAGYHGADGLNVLKVAAEGAKVGNADMATVADGATTALNAFHKGAGDATDVVNAMVAAVGAGKTNMTDLSASLATVAPTASVAGVQLNEMLAALATMTAEGTPAADAATYLKQTIAQLSNPTAKARGEMKDLGLDYIQVAQNLKNNGIASTLNEMTTAITDHMGPAGTVLIETLKKAAGNTTQFQQVLADLPPTQQTYIAAMADMVGGTKSMQAALELTGGNADTFAANIHTINGKVKDGAGQVAGWNLVQGDFNTKLSEAKGHIEAMGIKIGEKLLPPATKMLGWAMDSVHWLGKHKDAMYALGSVLGGVLVVGLVAATIAAWNFTVALLANPITWIVLAIAALIFGIVELATHWDTVWRFIKRIGEDVGHWFAHDFAGWFVDAFHFIMHWFQVIYIDPWIEAWRLIQDGAKAVADWFKGPFVNGFMDAWHGLEHIVDNFMDIGKNIVHGIISGLEGEWHELTDSLSKLAHSLPSAIQHVLGISSPSRVFAEEVGKWIPHGIAQGVSQYGGVATASLASLAGGLSATGSLALAGGYSADGSVGTSNGGDGSGMLQADIHIDGQRLAQVLVPYVQRINNRNASSYMAPVGR